MSSIRCSESRLAQQDTLCVALHGLTVDWDLHPARTRVCVLPVARQADVAQRSGRHSGTAIVSSGGSFVGSPLPRAHGAMPSRLSAPYHRIPSTSHHPEVWELATRCHVPPSLNLTLPCSTHAVCCTLTLITLQLFDHTKFH